MTQESCAVLPWHRHKLPNKTRSSNRRTMVLIRHAAKASFHGKLADGWMTVMRAMMKGRMVLILSLLAALNTTIHFPSPLSSHLPEANDGSPGSSSSSPSGGGEMLLNRRSDSRMFSEKQSDNTRSERRVQFLANGDFSADKSDAFSATWWQTRERFLSKNLSSIGSCEGASFLFMNPSFPREVKMTRDWLDFSVEHLSKWWKILKALTDVSSPIPYQTIVSRLVFYIGNDVLNKLPEEEDLPQNVTTTTRRTIAVIPFMPYQSRTERSSWGQHLTVASVAATISSLARQGFGRVVLASFDSEDDFYVRTAIRLLRDKSLWEAAPSSVENTDLDWERTIQGAFQEYLGNSKADDSTNSSLFVSRFGSIEIGFVSMTRPKDKHRKNVPRATLKGLRNAFLGNFNTSETELWLGPRSRDPSFWRYVYLTEADTILQTRRSNLPDFQTILDDNLLLVPHRLQPVPHESDVQGYDDNRRFIPSLGPMKEVRSLDASLNGGVSCCDLGINRPCSPAGSKSPSCNVGWYFNETRQKETIEKSLQRHSLLWNYSLVRLEQGVGIVTLAANNHGRQCLPIINMNGGSVECPIELE